MPNISHLLASLGCQSHMNNGCVKENAVPSMKTRLELSTPLWVNLGKNIMREDAQDTVKKRSVQPGEE
jgi:hypothetical protein